MANDDRLTNLISLYKFVTDPLMQRIADALADLTLNERQDALQHFEEVATATGLPKRLWKFTRTLLGTDSVDRAFTHWRGLSPESQDWVAELAYVVDKSGIEPEEAAMMIAANRGPRFRPLDGSVQEAVKV